jgi:polyphosphate kinase 2 (PPK2 family)
MNYSEKFIIEPGSKMRLTKIDPSFSGKHESHKTAIPETAKEVERMDRLQYLLYADSSQSLFIVLQGLDAAGKDGVIRHLLHRHPAFDRYRESYPRRSELHQNYYSRDGDEQSAVPDGV